jgi:ribosome-associated protein
MDIRKLQRVIVDALDDVKAQDIRVFNTTGQTELFDRVILATGTSNRQTRALASQVRDKVKAAGGQVISTEGDETGEWVLVDLGDAVVHIMQPAIRSYYNLEEIWGEKPVRLKPSEAPALRFGPGGGSGSGEAGAKKPATRKSAAKKPDAGHAEGAEEPTAKRSAGARKPGAGAKKSAAATGLAGTEKRTDAAEPATPRRRTVARKAPVAASATQAALAPDGGDGSVQGLDAEPRRVRKAGVR